MNWNIYDQARFVNYPAGGGGYWQEKPDAVLKFIYEEFPKRFSKAVGCINDWTPDDFMGGMVADGADVWLLRVHNGGADGEGRPHRWCVYACKVRIPPGRALNLSRWLSDPAWPAPAVTPLPAQIPLAGYQPPTVAVPESVAANATIDSSCPSLDDAQTELYVWFAAPGRGNGKMIFSSFNGKFVSKQRLEITPISDKVELIPKERGVDVLEARKPKTPIAGFAACFLLGVAFGAGGFYGVTKFGGNNPKPPCACGVAGCQEKDWDGNWHSVTNTTSWTIPDCPTNLLQVVSGSWKEYGFSKPIPSPMTTNDFNKILPQFRHDNHLTNGTVEVGIELKIRVSNDSIKEQKTEVKAPPPPETPPPSLPCACGVAECQEKNWGSINWYNVTNEEVWTGHENCPTNLLQVFSENWKEYGFSKPIPSPMETNDFNKILPQFRHDNHLTNDTVEVGIELQIRASKDFITKEVKKIEKEAKEEAEKVASEAKTEQNAVQQIERQANASLTGVQKKLEKAKEEVEKLKTASQTFTNEIKQIIGTIQIPPSESVTDSDVKKANSAKNDANKVAGSEYTNAKGFIDGLPSLLDQLVEEADNAVKDAEEEFEAVNTALKTATQKADDAKRKADEATQEAKNVAKAETVEKAKAQKKEVDEKVLLAHNAINDAKGKINAVNDAITKANETIETANDAIEKINAEVEKATQRIEGVKVKARKAATTAETEIKKINARYEVKGWRLDQFIKDTPTPSKDKDFNLNDKNDIENLRSILLPYISKNYLAYNLESARLSNPNFAKEDFEKLVLPKIKEDNNITNETIPKGATLKIRSAK